MNVKLAAFSILQDAKISKRESQVLNLIIHEFTNNEIASALFISNQTVATHRRNLIQKLQVRNTAGLVRKSIELGIITVPIHQDFLNFQS